MDERERSNITRAVREVTSFTLTASDEEILGLAKAIKRKQARARKKEYAREYRKRPEVKLKNRTRPRTAEDREKVKARWRWRWENEEGFREKECARKRIEYARKPRRKKMPGPITAGLR